MGKSELSGPGTVLLFFGGAVIFIILVMITAFLIRPSRPNREKLSVYECGEEPSGSAWGRFNIRFYVIALIFILFDVELVFLFPWAIVFANKSLIEATSGKWGWFALTEMFIFIGIISLGLAYAWKKGFLEWDKPKESLLKPAAPGDKYRKINLKYRVHKIKEVTRN